MNRRRIMMKEESGQTGPLYPIPEGTGVFAGTGGNVIDYTYTSSGTRLLGVYGKTSGSSASAYNNKAKKFTLPAGSHVVFTIKVLGGSTNRIILVAANGTTTVMGRNSSMTVGETYTIEQDMTADADVGELGVRCGKAVQAEVTLTVDGVRYI